MIEKTCESCGRVFQVYKCREGARFCSNGCRGEWMKNHDASPLLVKPNLSPSPELSWILGTMYSDGSRYTDGKGREQIELKALDLEYVAAFGRCVASVVGRKYEIGEAKTPKGKRLFRVRFVNKILGRFFGDRDLKREHRDIAERFPTMFLQAFFDGDGGAYFGKGRGFVQCYGENRNLLNYISHLLGTLGIGSTVSTKKSAGTFRCSVWGRDNINKFRELIGFSIGRKQERLESMTELCLAGSLQR